VNRFTALTEQAHEKKNNRTGILITNLGTPDEPDTASVRRYLNEFLSDPRVVEIPRLVWLVILHGIILRVRPAKSARLYKSIWTEDGSPLMAIGKRQRDLLEQVLRDSGQQDFELKLAMRYGKPSITGSLRAFQQQGIHRVVVLPLYPQYAGPTTGSTFDVVTNELRQWRWVPELHFINSYHDHTLYIEALAKSIRKHFDEYGKPQKLVLSYHGMPKRNLMLGDPYHCQCQKTTRLVVEQLGLGEEEYVTTFQSRFGKAEWLQPYTDATLESLPGQGIKDVAIISPAFSADCLETIEELDQENRKIFMGAGGEQYRYIPCLNDDDDHISLMMELVQPYL
jgi:ferrochelatase